MKIEAVNRSLDANVHLSLEVKESIKKVILNQIDLFSQMYNGVSLENLAQKLQTLEFETVSPYVNDVPLKYQSNANKIQINRKMLEELDNVDFEFMKITLEMLVQNDKDPNHLLLAFNDGMANMIASNLIGGSEKMTPEDSLVQMISSIANQDRIMESYLKNDPEILIDELSNLGIPMDLVVNLLEKMNYDKTVRDQTKTSNYKESVSLILNNISDKVDINAINNIGMFVITNDEIFDTPEIQFGNLQELDVLLKQITNTKEMVSTKSFL